MIVLLTLVIVVAVNAHDHACGRNIAGPRARQTEIGEEFGREIKDNEGQLKLIRAEKVRKNQMQGLVIGGKDKGMNGFPFEVQFDYTPLSKMTDTKAKDFIINVLTPRIALYLNRIIKLKQPPVENVNAFYSTCYKTKFSKSFDFRGGLGILVTADTFGEEDVPYVAFSLVCKQDPVTYRPILGQLNFNPSELQPHKFNTMFETTIHEVFHILGFSSDMFGYFIDDNLNFIAQFNMFKMNEFNRIIGIKTPTVLEQARIYYNCSNIDYLPLEDEGSIGSAFSHWERSQFFDEVMTASSISNSKISLFTLSLLQDSGWYNVDLKFSEQYTFLKNSKCNFSTDAYSCNVFLDQICSYDYKSQGFCYVDNFNNENMRPTSNHEGNCASSFRASKKTRFFQSYGPKSYCFEAAMVQKDNDVVFTLDGPACFDAICFHNENNQTVRFTVGQQQYFCAEDNAEINIDTPDLRAIIKCPLIDRFCRSDYNCASYCFEQGRCLENGSCYNYD